MDFKQLSNDNDYTLAVERLEEIFDAPASVATKEEYDQLSELIVNYEDERFSLR